MPENLDYEEVFEDIFEKYTKTHTKRRTKTADLGSIYELTYDIFLKDNVSEKGFIDELRCRNGNLTITLSQNKEED